MSSNKIERLIAQMENYLECWKQFSWFLNLGGGKKFGAVGEDEFLGTKGVLVQELELILASIEVSSPTKDEVHTLIGNTPSLRYLSELNEGAIRNIESQWHKIYIGWHSILGQLKVRANDEVSQGPLASLLGKKKKSK